MNILGLDISTVEQLPWSYRGFRLIEVFKNFQITLKENLKKPAYAT